VFRCVLGSESCVLVPRSSGTPVATWAWPTWVVSRRRVLEAMFILLEFPSPSRRIFIGSHSLPPLSGSPYRSFCFKHLLDVLRDMLPEGNQIAESVYEAKKIICPLRIEVEKIHVC
jgi:hypothetical protein